MLDLSVSISALQSLVNQRVATFGQVAGDIRVPETQTTSIKDSMSLAASLKCS